MHISEMRIRNFRNFHKAKFSFGPNINTLIGENGSGKTNALYALRILLDENLSRNSIYLKESDFNRKLENWRGNWIVISIDFSNLDPSEGCQFLKHEAGHMDGSNTGTLTYFFRPKAEVRQRLYELNGSPDNANELLAELTVDDYEPWITGRATGDFLDDAIYEELIGDHQEGNFPNPEDDDQSIVGVRTRSIHQEVACTFARALRDVVSELRSYKGNPLLNLLRGMESSIEVTDATRIADKVSNLNADISSLDEIEKLTNGIENALHNAVGHTYSPGVSIESALPDTMEQLFQKLCVLVGDNSTSEYRGQLQEQSLGGANLIYLALKLLEYEFKLAGDRAAHFLLIEEPESHIHTHIQKTLFSNLPTSNTQVIVSTHSTHISSVSKISCVNVLAKNDQCADVYQPANQLSSDKIARVERYLDSVRSTLLFAKGVLLVEGDAELVTIPALVKSIFGMSTDELGFSVISMGSAFFEHIAIIFSDERIQRPCAIVTDLDESIFELPDNPLDDNEEQSSARKSMEAGAQRQSTLDNQYADNAWVNIFYAINTFEVDFLFAGNTEEVRNSLDAIYTNQAYKLDSRNKLDSEDTEESGREILRLANKVGKGWFALLIAEQIKACSQFPPYILEAIAFACHKSISDNTIMKIGIYRIQNPETNNPVNDLLAELDTLRSGTPENFISRFIEAAPNDQLSLFYQCILDFRTDVEPNT